MSAEMLPACAGVILSQGLVKSGPHYAPRMRGGDPIWAVILIGFK